jgi:hypothetical protein
MITSRQVVSVLMALGALSACGCSNEPSQPGDVARTTLTTTAAEASAAAAVREFVAAIDRGDIESANQLLCEGRAPVADDDIRLGVPMLRDQLGGHIRVERIIGFERDRGLLSVKVKLEGGAPFEIVTVESDDRTFRVCYEHAPASDALLTSAPNGRSAGAPVTSVDAVENLVPAGYKLVPPVVDRVDHPERFDGYLTSRQVTFSSLDPTDGRPLVTVTAYDFTDESAANTATGVTETQFRDAIVGRVDVPLRAARGFRALTFYRTVVQPPDRGLVSDLVDVRLGTRLWTIDVAALDPKESSEMALSVVDSLAALEPELGG